MKIKAFFILVIAVFFFSCKELYVPPSGTLNTSLLVVEANLDPSGTTSILLSRTTNLQDPTLIRTENNAVVTVEGKDNTVQSLVSQGNGYYNGNLSLILSQEYRLRIKNAGKEYLSDYVRTISNPPLDSITWNQDNEGVRIYVNTNDPIGATKYFRWDYVETWEIRSYFPSEYIFVTGALRPRIFPAEDVRVCWKHSPSTQIFLANSAQLQSGIISQVPVLQIVRGNEKLLWRYSIIAKQYALGKDAYNFFEILKKNTEDIGSFFGPLPAELRGNIHCLTIPDEPVIGFVTSSSVSQKRIFIDGLQVTNWPGFLFCEEKRIPNNIDSIRQAALNGYSPAYYLVPPVNSYVFSTPECVDCTTRGGSNIRPLFW